MEHGGCEPTVEVPSLLSPSLSLSLPFPSILRFPLKPGGVVRIKPPRRCGKLPGFIVRFQSAYRYYNDFEGPEKKQFLKLLRQSLMSPDQSTQQTCANQVADNVQETLGAIGEVREQWRTWTSCTQPGFFCPQNPTLFCQLSGG